MNGTIEFNTIRTTKIVTKSNTSWKIQYHTDYLNCLRNLLVDFFEPQLGLKHAQALVGFDTTCMTSMGPIKETEGENSI